MKIKKVDAFVVHAQDTTKGMENERDVGGHSGFFVLVHIQTDSGIDGWGECSTGSEFGEAAFSVKAIIDRGFTPHLIGADPLEFRKIWEKLYLSTENYGRRDAGVLAISGIDTALIDIAAKKYEVPACVLMGGCYRKEIPLYASILFDMDDPLGTVKKGARYVEENYSAVKFGWGMTPSKPFGADRRKDELIVSTVREKLGKNIKIMIDVGRYVNLTVPQAIQLTKWLERYDITWVEEPLPRDDFEGYCALSRSVSTTMIAAGESYRTIHDFKRAIINRAVHLLQPDVSKAGGLSETKRIVEMAHAFNTPWVPHNWSTAVNAAASLHLVASSPDGFLVEFKQEPNPLIQKITKREFTIKDGKMQVPEGIGLGIEINEDIVSKYEAPN